MEMKKQPGELTKLLLSLKRQKNCERDGNNQLLTFQIASFLMHSTRRFVEIIRNPLVHSKLKAFFLLLLRSTRWAQPQEPNSSENKQSEKFRQTPKEMQFIVGKLTPK